MSNIEKKCIVCGQSCAGQPRIKDASGNYAHRACAEKHQAKQDAKAAQPEIEPLDLSPEEEPGMADFLDDLPSDSAGEPATMRAACPGCGRAVDQDAVVCMSCGFNTQTGKTAKVSKAKAINSDDESVGLVSQTSDVAIGILKPIIGACIGGAIGAGIWAAIAFYLNFEVGYVAVLIGILTGLGAVAGAGGGGDVVAFIALVVAVLSIGAGKYIAINAFLQYNADPTNLTLEAIKEIYSPESLTELDVHQYMVDVYAFEILESGESIEWPNPGISIENAVWPDDYPDDLVEYTISTWESISVLDRQVVLTSASNYYSEMAYEDPESFISTAPIAFSDVLGTLDFFDMIWIIAAMFGTWQVASRDY